MCGGPDIRSPTPFTVNCETQAMYWEKLLAAAASCGWLTDNSTPTILTRMLRAMEKANAVMQAMMKMIKLDTTMCNAPTTKPGRPHVRQAQH